MLKEIPVAEYQATLQELPRRWTKCINSGGDYFEGQGINCDQIAPEVAQELQESDSEDD